MEKIRESFCPDNIIDIIEKEKFDNISGDAINVLYQGHIDFLPQSWALIQWIDSDYLKIQEYIPVNISDEIKSTKHAYAISIRSISNASLPVQSFAGQVFWNFSRHTPFYEQLILQSFSNFGAAIYNIQARLGFFDTRSGARKLADKLLPKGSKRREFAKLILPKGSRRWNFCKQIYFLIRPKYRPKKEAD